MVLAIFKKCTETNVKSKWCRLQNAVIALSFMMAWFSAQKFGDNPTIVPTWVPLDLARPHCEWAGCHHHQATDVFIEEVGN